jgi:hypothetical protein
MSDAASRIDLQIKGSEGHLIRKIHMTSIPHIGETLHLLDYDRSKPMTYKVTDVEHYVIGYAPRPYLHEVVLTLQLIKM